LGASPAEAPAQGSRDAVETKNNDATTRAQKTRCGNETGCVDRSRGGLFDIVKKDGAATALGRRRAMCDNGSGAGKAYARI
jgi:hypothetical protein